MSTATSEDTTFVLLQSALSTAVPFWIEDLKRRTADYILERATACGEHIAGPAGADLLYRSKKAGATAESFNRLAEGVACLAFFPGGVTTFGLHFEAKHPDF